MATKVKYSNLIKDSEGNFVCCGCFELNRPTERVDRKDGSFEIHCECGEDLELHVINYEAQVADIVWYSNYLKTLVAENKAQIVVEASKNEMYVNYITEADDIFGNSGEIMDSFEIPYNGLESVIAEINKSNPDVVNYVINYDVNPEALFDKIIAEQETPTDNGSAVLLWDFYKSMGLAFETFIYVAEMIVTEFGPNGQWGGMNA